MGLRRCGQANECLRSIKHRHFSMRHLLVLLLLFVNMLTHPRYCVLMIKGVSPRTPPLTDRRGPTLFCFLYCISDVTLSSIQHSHH